MPLIPVAAAAGRSTNRDVLQPGVQPKSRAEGRLQHFGKCKQIENDAHAFHGGGGSYRSRLWNGSFGSGSARIKVSRPFRKRERDDSRVVGVVIEIRSVETLDVTILKIWAS